MARPLVAALQGKTYRIIETMQRTIGYHLVKSGYRLWLPGDDRGSWPDAGDEQIGYHQPHTLSESGPIRKRMAQKRMQHPPVHFT